MEQYRALLLQFAYDVGIIVIGLALFLSLITGVWLLAAPQSFSRFRQVTDRWISVRPLLKPLEAPFFMERNFYRHHKLFGLFILGGSTYTLLRIRLNYSDIERWLANEMASQYQLWLPQSLILLLLLTNIIALLIGIFVFFRPSLLKTLEKSSNRWISSRRFLRALDLPHQTADNWLCQHHKLIASLLLLSAIYLTIFLILMYNKAL